MNSKVNSLLLQKRWKAILKQKISSNHRPAWVSFVFSGADFYSPWAPVTVLLQLINQKNIPWECSPFFFSQTLSSSSGFLVIPIHINALWLPTASPASHPVIVWSKRAIVLKGKLAVFRLFFFYTLLLFNFCVWNASPEYFSLLQVYIYSFNHANTAELWV